MSFLAALAASSRIESRPRYPHDEGRGQNAEEEDQSHHQGIDHVVQEQGADLEPDEVQRTQDRRPDQRGRQEDATAIPTAQ